MNKKILSFMLVALLLFPLVGCGQQAGESNGKMKIGVSFQTLQHEFFVNLKEGIEETAKANDIDIVFADANFDFDKQRSAIEDFITQEVDAILIVPVNSAGIASTIETAQKKDIPVITMDIGSDEEVEDLYVASDNYLGGKLIGEYLVKDLAKTEGNMFIMTAPEDLSIRERVDGFNEIIKDYPNLKVVSDQHGGVLRDKALQVTENVLQANPDLDIIFASNDEMTMGALQAVEAAGKSKDITIVGYDVSNDIKEALEKETALKAVTAQFPYDIGKCAVESAKKLAEGEKLDKKIGVPVKVATPENIKELFN